MIAYTSSPRFFLLLCLLVSGCRSPYYADRGLGFGALAGAGTGAIIGNQVGNAGTGAVIGAGLGALTGAVVGNTLDDIAAQNRAQIAAQMGRQVQAGAASINEVVAMHRAGVDPRLIQNYVRTSGVTQPISAADVIHLHGQGVPTDVIQTMQNPPVVAARPPVVVEEHFYGPPGCYGDYHHGFYPPPGRRVSWGVSIGH